MIPHKIRFARIQLVKSEKLPQKYSQLLEALPTQNFQNQNPTPNNLSPGNTKNKHIELSLHISSKLKMKQFKT